eukprot:Clim_evm125s157 gene=Clim_evmTU125s157
MLTVYAAALLRIRPPQTQRQIWNAVQKRYVAGSHYPGTMVEGRDGTGTTRSVSKPSAPTAKVTDVIKSGALLTADGRSAVLASSITNCNYVNYVLVDMSDKDGAGHFVEVLGEYLQSVRARNPAMKIENILIDVSAPDGTVNGIRPTSGQINLSGLQKDSMTGWTGGGGRRSRQKFKRRYPERWEGVFGAVPHDWKVLPHGMHWNWQSLEDGGPIRAVRSSEQRPVGAHSVVITSGVGKRLGRIETQHLIDDPAGLLYPNYSSWIPKLQPETLELLLPSHTTFVALVQDLSLPAAAKMASACSSVLSDIGDEMYGFINEEETGDAMEGIRRRVGITLQPDHGTLLCFWQKANGAQEMDVQNVGGPDFNRGPYHLEKMVRNFVYNCLSNVAKERVQAMK